MLELLQALERSSGQCRKFQERIAAESVKAQVLQMARVDQALAIAHPRNRRTRKVKRAILEIENRLDHVGVHDFGGDRDRHGERGHADFSLGIERLNRGVDCGGIE